MKWLTTGQVAKELQVERHTVYDLADKGILPCFQVGKKGRRKFPENYADAMLKSLEQEKKGA